MPHDDGKGLTPPKLTRKDFTSDQDVRWCPGCGDYAILAQVQRVMPELGIPRHQIVFVSGLPETEHQFVMADHMAFRTSSLDDLRAIGVRRDEAGVEGVIPVDHGNAWSLYFNDPEGNGLECFVDSPFHVAQPYADELDLSADDTAIEADTRAKIEDDDEFQPMAAWRDAFRARLDTDATGS